MALMRFMHSKAAPCASAGSLFWAFVVNNEGVAASQRGSFH
jgi:hypothetical protein